MAIRHRYLTEKLAKSFSFVASGSAREQTTPPPPSKVAGSICFLPWSWPAGLLLLFLGGCGGPKYYPVSGQVLLDGQPVAQAAVMFHPRSAGPVGSAVTDEKGNYHLVTANQAGALAGEYDVTITKQRTRGVRADETVEAGGLRVDWLVPPRYSLAGKSELKASVPSAPPRYDFSLTSK